MEGTFTGEELMKQIMMIATLLLMPPVLIFSQTKDEGEKQKFEREVMKAEEEWRAAVAEGDATVLKRLMADDVEASSQINPSSRLWSKIQPEI
jgi:hypothetical protein